MNQPANPQPSNSNMKWWLLGGGGCLLILCLCVVAVGGYFLISKNGISSLPFMQATDEPAMPTFEIPLAMPTATPIPEPTAVEPPAQPEATAAPEATIAAAPTFSSSQYVDDSSLSDDFSSKALGWPEFDDGKTIIKYENNAYSFKIAEPDYYDWAYAPVTFMPTYIEFDVWGLPGHQDGTVGVMCQIQDADNHYYIELDLGYREFIAATIIDGETHYLTGTANSDDVWDSAEAINPAPDQVNRVAVYCSQDMLSLTINGSQVYAEALEKAYLPPGEMGLFVFANEDASDGYQVYFDNVIIAK